MSLLIANFRDVGETVNMIADRMILREGVLYRGGKFESAEDLAKACSAKTVINLRKGKNPDCPGAQTLNFPAPDSVDVYSVRSGFNRKWIIAVLIALTESDNQRPFYVHCAAGKDRTGIVVAAVLSAIGVAQSIINEEYGLSTGLLRQNLFKDSVAELSEVEYFRKVPVGTLRELFLA